MEFVSILVLQISLSLALSTVNNVGAVNSTLLEPCHFPAIYNFGGSNSDTGGLSAVFSPIPAPYGQTFFKRPAGRVSDGRLVIDFIAEHLKLPHLSAYLNSLEANFKHGANFATIGATFLGWQGTFRDQGPGPFGFFIQLQLQFNQFKNRTIDLYNQRKDRSILPNPKGFSKALYIIDIGDSDLSIAFRQLGIDKVPAAIPNITTQFANHVRGLYEKGARTFWIHNSSPIGCFPNTTLSFIKDPKPGLLDQNGCVKSQNHVVMKLNKQLKNKVIKLRTQLPDAAITYVDVYTAVYDLISNAESQGFTDPMKICCGIHKNGGYVECGKKGNINSKKVFAGSCKDPSMYISWDGLHYTEAANHWIASRIINGSLSDPPIPITHACHRST